MSHSVVALMLSMVAILNAVEEGGQQSTSSREGMLLLRTLIGEINRILPLEIQMKCLVKF
jgi:hypothetical protein